MDWGFWKKLRARLTVKSDRFVNFLFRLNFFTLIIFAFKAVRYYIIIILGKGLRSCEVNIIYKELPFLTCKDDFNINASVLMTNHG